MKKIIRGLIRVYRFFSRKYSRFLVKSQVQIVGANFICDEDVKIYGGENIVIGDNVIINKGVILQSCEGAKIVIGDNVTLSYNVTILTGNLFFKTSDLLNNRRHNSKNVIISNNVWVGANSLVLPGIEISDNIIIAAGSVLTKSTSNSNSIYAGNPAKLIKSL